MKQDERKRKFNEAVVNMLYPSPPPSPPQLELEPFIKGSTSDIISGTLDDNDNASTSGEEEQSCETEKLTRAQRKKIRKKKLKEEAIHRGRLIGPMLPLPHATTRDQVAERAPPVRSNASEKDIGLGDETASASSNKMKRRRLAKRLAKQKQIASTPENCNQSSSVSSVVVQKETHM
ncbi:PREDICTED: uncharacterized protein LOC109348832 isoform X1 [Lupinus angustifolius]|uniref:uncharacterized protein LOC109348832 isoform X1 n=1 Tax=Lupinus angustifolius TaxID=3871 RepID=UPI00092E8719|nr:PREDICTED: uncharacterized protein LOC109348832 isoform X1 [Lupinus angustifolius]